MFKSIQTKIMFYFIFLGASLLIVFGYLFILGLEGIAKDEIYNNAKANAIYEASRINLLKPSPSGDVTKEELQKLLSEDDIYSHEVINKEDSIPYDLDFQSKGKGEKIYREGSYYVVGVSPIYPNEKNNFWYVVSEQPASKAFKTINTMKTVTIVLIVILLIGLWVLGKRISFSIQRPIKALADESTRVASGDISEGITTKEAGELMIISQSFNQLLDHLKATMRDVLAKSGEAAEMQDIMEYVNVTYEELASGVIAVNNVGEITTFNGMAEELTGIKAEALVGINISNPTPTGMKNILDPIKRCLSSGRIQLKMLSHLEHKSGEKISIQYSTNVQFGLNNEVLGALCVFKRIADIKRFEESAIQTKNLQSLGEMAASLAHEIKNPLTSIRGYAQYAKMELAEHQVKVEELDIILKEADRLTTMLDNFLKFAKPEIPQKEWIPLNQIIDYAVTLLEKEIAEDIQVRKKYLDSPKVFVDISQLQSVFINLLLNGIQAMPHGGILNIVSKYDKGRKMASVTIRDSGKGISADLSEKIFQPFFTTKEEGTGMGLAICYRIIDAHDGLIEVESIEGEMTTFTVLIRGKEEEGPTIGKEENFSRRR